MQDFERIEVYRAGGSNPASIAIFQSADGVEMLSIRGTIISSLKSFVDRHSEALKQDFKNTHHPERSMCEKIGDWYFYIAFAWVFDCLDDKGKDRPDMTIAQFFLAACWSITPVSCGTERFWETMICALTDGRRNKALNFRSKLMKYAKLNHQHDVNDTVQASFLQNVESWTRVRKFCVTAEGQIGWVPIEAQYDDILCVFEGADLPYVLRRHADEDTFTIVGHCFIHGAMFGEVTASNGRLLDNIILR